LPTAVPTGTPATASPSPTPAATSTAATAICPPPTPYPSPDATTIAFATNTGTIAIPPYQDATGTADIPTITAGLPASVTIKDSRANYDNAPNPGMGTPVLYASLVLTQPAGGSGSVTFSSASIPVHITSPCSVAPGRTYNVFGYAVGAQIEAKTNISPDADGKTVSTTLDIPPLYGMSFPTNITVDIVATQN
jgi:hypothetical protein